MAMAPHLLYHLPSLHVFFVFTTGTLAAKSMQIATCDEK
jgi:hypothetical protein